MGELARPLGASVGGRVKASAYPHVLGELETLQAICAGQSIARYGDGEFAMAAGYAMKTQTHDPALSTRLRQILFDSGDCLVGVPNIHPSIETPKRTGWNKHLERGCRLLRPGRAYVSSFITRPDSAPWINTPDYWALLETLWVGRDIVLVRGSDKSLRPTDLVGATRIREVIGPEQHAWTEYPRLMDEIGVPTARVLICLGATATVIAHDLCAQGVHAVDLGHIGGFLRKHRRGEPMWLPKDIRQPDGFTKVATA